jgi:glycosyltransferase involved in cell wall biosynthesis
MRIAHIDTGKALRGGQRQLLLLMRGLARQGHEQVLLAPESTRREWGGRGQEPALSAVWKAARDADVVHAHDARGHTLTAVCCGGTPLVVSRRVAFPVQRGLLSRWKYSRPKCFIAVSSYVAEQLQRSGVDRGKISVVYDGVAMASVGGDSRSIAQVRTMDRLDRGMGHSSTERTSGGPRESNGILAVAIKSDDPLKRSDLALDACRRAEIDLRFSDNLPRDLPGADVFLYLSESEGLGSAILLAMASGVPVVASRLGGIPELVDDEVSGLLVPNEAGPVSHALRRMIDDRDFARQCRRHAFEKVEREFRDDIMVRRTEQIYRAVVEGLPLP